MKFSGNEPEILWYGNFRDTIPNKIARAQKGDQRMNNWKYKFYQLMQGRYGIDSFGRFLLIAAMVVILLSNFHFLHKFYFLGLLLLIYAYFRIMSRNIFKRQRENEKYMALRQKFTRNRNHGTMSNWNRGPNGAGGPDMANSSLAYSFYRCQNCGQTVRVPKGKGTLKITCPNCGNSFIQRT